MDDDSDSSLSSTHSTDDEALVAKMNKPVGIQRFFKPTPKNEEKEPTPEPPKRAPSPPHEYVLADNDAIAFVVMFRSRFSDAFPKSLPHYGPQDIERGVTSDTPQEDVERLLCALLSLVLNRKKDVEKGHYGRALEDAIQQNQSQWPKAWNGKNPLHGGGSFNSMIPEERITLLKTLVLWALNSSEAVQNLIKTAYKQTRRDDDKNQPKSVQPWFSDSWRRKYYLIEGLEDTHFRVYRENDGKTAKTNTWFNIAGSIEDVTALAEKFEGEGTNLGKVNGGRIRSAIPRFEAGDEKRKRRDYRLARKAAFATRAEPGFSSYEGRTRGKRMRYTYSDGEEEDSDTFSGRKSARNSGYVTPMENGPTVTSSGRQVKSRIGGMYGESLPNDQRREMERDQDSRTSGEDEGNTLQVTNRRSRTAPKGRGRYADGLESESETDAGAGAESSGKEWSGNEDESDDDGPELDFDEGDDGEDDINGLEDGDDDEEEEDNTHESLVVQLRYRPGSKLANLTDTASRKGTPLREVMNASNDEPTKDTMVEKIAVRINGKVTDNYSATPQEYSKTAVNGSNTRGPGEINGIDAPRANGFSNKSALTPYPTKTEVHSQPPRAMDLT